LAFFEEAFYMKVERLAVLAPYVDDAAFADETFRNLWKRVLATADCTVVVRTTAAAEALLRAQLRQTHFDLRVNPKLHAKVFLAWRRGAEIALLGSQNLTGAALHTNDEIGILIKPAADGMTGIVSQLRAAVGVLIRTSSPHRANTYPALKGQRSRNNGEPLTGRNAFIRVNVGDSRD
jgi:phosphatidylserine/phosphatidylglycerophosphate/cardiolipin synthase-like enzyme